jgi:hypothetical protein
MHIHKLSMISAATLFLTGAAQAQNLTQNPDFLHPSTHLTHDPPPEVDYTSGATDLAGYAAADDWLVWTVAPHGRVHTWLEPSELYGPASRMLHVKGQEIDQPFLAWHTGPQHVHFCVLLKVVSGTVFAAVGDGGNSPRSGDTAIATGTWTRIGGENGVSPANEIGIEGETPKTEFYVQEVQVSEQPIPCDHEVQRLNRLPETHVQPLIPPWLMHPEFGNDGNAKRGRKQQTEPATTPFQQAPAQQKTPQ